MPYVDIIERMVVSRQLKMGMSSTDILVAHYDGLWRKSRMAGRSRMAVEYREARDVIARISPQFFIDIARATKTSLVSIIQIFKDRGVVKLFNEVGWSFDGFWNALKGGYKTYVIIQNVIAEYLAETKAMRWTKEKMEGLDEYLRNHPRTKRLAGVALGLLLLYLWIVMADTGDIDFDLDISEVVEAMGGGYSLTKLFSGPDGAKYLTALAVGMATNLSFPWPGPTAIRFVMAVVRILAKKVKTRLQPAKKSPEQEAKDVGVM